MNEHLIALAKNSVRIYYDVINQDKHDFQDIILLFIMTILYPIAPLWWIGSVIWKDMVTYNTIYGPATQKV